MCLVSKWSSKIDNFLASNAQIPHVELHLMLLLHKTMVFYKMCAGKYPLVSMESEDTIRASGNK
jgi:hypothetical protein